jgi:hypothetical protein
MVSDLPVIKTPCPVNAFVGRGLCLMDAFMGRGDIPGPYVVRIGSGCYKWYQSLNSRLVKGLELWLRVLETKLRS